MSGRGDFYARVEAMSGSAQAADRLAAELWRDVTGRRGWRQEADQFDDAVKHEIIDAWLDILAAEFGSK